MRNPTKYYSEIQETAVAKYLGGKLVSGSGSRATRPGDIEYKDWLCECKTHVAESDNVIFKNSEWAKIKSEATSKFKYPVLICDNGSQSLKHTWCMYPLYFDRSQYTTTTLPVEWKTNIKFNKDLLSKDIIYLVLSKSSDEPLCISSIEKFKQISMEI